MAERQTFGTINGLRGVAALVVVAYHCTSLQTLNLKYGFLAVDLFFVLSGFVIAHAYEERLKTVLSFRQFFLVRLVRFYPLYILGTLIGIFVVASSFAIQGHVTAPHAIALRSIPFSLFMLPAPPSILGSWNANLYPLDFPAWSLLLEMAVNLIYAASIRFWTAARLAVVVALAGLLMLWSHFSYAGFNDGGGWNWSNLAFGFLRVFYSFPAGVLIYRAYKSGISLPPVPSPLIVVAFPLALMLPQAWIVPLDALFVFPLLVVLAAKSEPRGPLASLFATLGVASYAIYALHVPLYDLAERIFYVVNSHVVPHSAATAFDATFFVLIIPICVVADRIYDFPVRRLLSRAILK